MQTIFYGRTSVAEQTVAHQLTQAEEAGFKIDHSLIDDGVSGVSTRLYDRPQGRRLPDLLRRQDFLVCRWIDRLGRDYCDVFDTMRDLMKRGVIVRTVINNMTFDGSTTDPLQAALRDAMIAFLAGMAAAQVENMKAAQKAGIAHAKSIGRYRGRKPSYNADQLERANSMILAGDGVSSISRSTGLSRQTIYRIRDDYPAAAKILADWQG